MLSHEDAEFRKDIPFAGEYFTWRVYATQRQPVVVSPDEPIGHGSRLSHMRWFWIDRFVEFESGKFAKAVKNVSLAEEHLHDHFPGFAIMPGSLMIEGMAQTGGILLGEVNDFEHIVILAKVPKVTFHSWAVPGDSLVYTATLTDARDEGGGVDVTAYVGDRLVAEAEIMFVHLDQKNSQFGAIDQKNFVFSMNLLGILDVGQAGDGT